MLLLKNLLVIDVGPEVAPCAATAIGHYGIVFGYNIVKDTYLN